MSDVCRFSDVPVNACWDSSGSSQTVLESENNEVTEDTKKYTGPFSDPVYQQLSLINGRINKMRRDQVIRLLGEYNLDMSGNNDVLKKRLKNFYKEQKLTRAHLIDTIKSHRCSYKFLCIIDFEATCEEENELDYPHEIIEFPCVVVDTSQRKVVAEFHEYCKPVVNPILSNFCKNLTGISQEQVDQADIFPVVLSRFNEWISEKGLGVGQSYAVCTDGPWDMGRFLFKQCKISSLHCPSFSKKWINIRKTFSNFYKTRRMKLLNMLELLGMRFEGQPHCGLDDARNISRVAIKLLEDGADLKVNESMKWNSLSKDEKRQSKIVRSHTHNVSDFASSLNSNGPETFQNIDISSNIDSTNTRKKNDISIQDTILQMEQLEVDPEIAGTENVLLRGRFSAQKYLNYY